jgi:hypothetical protein
MSTQPTSLEKNAAADTTAAAKAPRRPARKAATKTGRADKADDITKVADVLKRFITENQLSSTVQGKTFVNVEAWQYAAGLLGYVVQVEQKVERTEIADAVVYSASASLYHIATGHSAGGGVGLCSSKESGKKFYQEFALASMAQTRAVSKCVRTAFGYLIKAAGFEATPAEEMDWDAAKPAAQQPAAPAQLPAAEPMKALPAATPAAAATDDRGPAEMNPRDEAQPPIGIDGKPAPGTPYATNDQREEMIRLLNHPLVTRQEKTKMLLNINRINEERAIAAIAKLRKAIEDREGTSAVAA